MSDYDAKARAVMGPTTDWEDVAALLRTEVEAAVRVEREACAKLADDEAKDMLTQSLLNDPSGRRDTAKVLAIRIRARGRLP